MNKRRRKNGIILIIILGIITALSGFFGNIASDNLPAFIQQYIWLAWPLFCVLVIFGIVFAIIEFVFQPEPHDLSGPEKLPCGEPDPALQSDHDEQFMPAGDPLYRALAERCNLSDLKDICFYLGLDAEHYPPLKGDFIRELLMDVDRKGRRSELASVLQQNKPWVLR